MNNTDTDAPVTPTVTRLGRPPARKQYLGTAVNGDGREQVVLRDTALGLDFPFTRASTARLVARQMLWDNTAQPPCGRPSDINPFGVKEWEELPTDVATLVIETSTAA